MKHYLQAVTEQDVSMFELYKDFPVYKDAVDDIDKVLFGSKSEKKSMLEYWHSFREYCYVAVHLHKPGHDYIADRIHMAIELLEPNYYH